MELVVAVSIITVFIVSVVYAHSLFLKTTFGNIQNIKVSFLLEETIEVVKFLGNTDWDSNIDSLNTSENYYLDFTGSSWQTSGISIPVDGKFMRYFVLEDVYRNQAGAITDSMNGDLDPSSKRLTAFISWQKNGDSVVRSLVSYIFQI